MLYIIPIITKTTYTYEIYSKGSEKEIKMCHYKKIQINRKAGNKNINQGQNFYESYRKQIQNIKRKSFPISNYFKDD